LTQLHLISVAVDDPRDISTLERYRQVQEWARNDVTGRKRFVVAIDAIGLSVTGDGHYAVMTGRVDR
jgi:hypothetical protein